MFKKLVLTALVVALSLSGAAMAVDYTWIGTTASADNWNVAANWVNGIPNSASGNWVYIDGTSYTVGTYDPNVTVTTQSPYMYLQNGGRLFIRAGNGGATPVYGFNTAGGQYWYITSDAVMEIYGGAQCSNNIYVGVGTNNAQTGTVNVYPGARLNMPGGVLTVGGRSAAGANTAQTGILNIWGDIYVSGTIRWNWNGSGNAKMTVYRTGTFSCQDGDGGTAAILQADIAAGDVAMGDPGYPVQVVYDAVNIRTTVSCYKSLKAYYPAYNPVLVPGPTGTTTAQLNAASGTIELAWTNPLPTGSGESNAVQSNVYFGETGGSLGMVAGPNTLDTAVTVNIAKSKNYQWRVDSWDPNMADTDANYVGVTGNVWAFDTMNVRPTVVAATDRAQVWVGNTTANLTATPSDDGYPAPSTLTYSWANTGDNAVTYTPDNTAQNPQITIGTGTSNQNYVFTCTISDGEYTGTGAVTVRLNDNACTAAKQAGTVVDTGDINADCVTNFIDVATVAAAWLDCNTSDGICPF